MRYKFDLKLACKCEYTLREVLKKDIPNLGDLYHCPQHGSAEVTRVRYRSH